MQSFKTIFDVLDFAIASEQKAVEFYTDMANKAESEAMKNAFLEFANEEKGHKAKLMKIKEEGYQAFSQESVKDLKISEYVDDVEESPEMTFKQALVLAMKREKAAFRLYSNLAYLTSNKEIKALFQSLAQEEAKHKLSFEIEYDENVLTDN